MGVIWPLSTGFAFSGTQGPERTAEVRAHTKGVMR